MNRDININKVYDYLDLLYKNMNFYEISKLYRGALYKEYKKLSNDDYELIHLYELLQASIGIFTQMLAGNKFDDAYLKNTIKW